MDDPRLDDAHVWRTAANASLAITDENPADDEYAEEFALNDIGIALRFSS